ncbi:MAG: hypothetical protein RLZZ251_677 [Actinomycetota bacterium]|jgi:hypothetical protein
MEASTDFLKRFTQVRPLIILIFSLLMIAPPFPPASANSFLFQIDSEYDSFDPPNLDPKYDLDLLSVGVVDNNPDLINIWLYFLEPVSPSMFISSANFNAKPWAFISIWRNKPKVLGDNSEDFRIATNSTTSYPADGGEIPANASGNSKSGAARVDLGKCKPKTSQNSFESEHNIKFTLSRSCANLPNSFYITAYVDPDTRNGGFKDFDYLPESTMYVDLSGTSTSVTSPTKAPSSSGRKPQRIITGDLPQDARLEEMSREVDATTTAGLQVSFEAKNQKVCRITSVEYVFAAIEILSEGLCEITVSQNGDYEFEPATPVVLSFMVVRQLAATPSTTPTPRPTATKATTTTTPKPTTVRKPTPTPSPSKTPKIGGTATTRKG